jgi:hypothetical protein
MALTARLRRAGERLEPSPDDIYVWQLQVCTDYFEIKTPHQLMRRSLKDFVCAQPQDFDEELMVDQTKLSDLPGLKLQTSLP